MSFNWCGRRRRDPMASNQSLSDVSVVTMQRCIVYKVRAASCRATTKAQSGLFNCCSMSHGPPLS